MGNILTKLLAAPLQKQLAFFVCSMLFVGGIIEFCGFVGLIFAPIGALILVPLCLLLCLLQSTTRIVSKLSSFDRNGLFLFVVVWSSHILQVFVPETGFDAVWYHLPVIAANAQAHQFVFVESLYQSLNPLFTDGLLLLGFLIQQAEGAKMIAYILGLTTISATYLLARTVVSRSWSIAVVCIVSVFQVVAWQSSSAYVDLGKAAWELAALWLLTKTSKDERRQLSNTVLAGLFFGASLATKQFSVALLPVFALVSYLSNRSVAKTVLFIITSLILPLPFFIFSAVHSGNPLFASALHIAQFSTGESVFDTVQQLTLRFLAVPCSFWAAATARDYVLPVVAFSPIALAVTYHKWQNKVVIVQLVLFSVSQWLLWWFVPPLSTRYALSGFITLTIASAYLLQTLLRKKYQAVALQTALLLVCILLVPRLLVNFRSARYLLGFQTQQQYVEQFYDGLLDPHLKKWHQL